MASMLAPRIFGFPAPDVGILPPIIERDVVRLSEIFRGLSNRWKFCIMSKGE
jgi:hypothetical protein